MFNMSIQFFLCIAFYLFSCSKKYLFDIHFTQISLCGNYLDFLAPLIIVLNYYFFSFIKTFKHFIFNQFYLIIRDLIKAIAVMRTYRLAESRQRNNNGIVLPVRIIKINYFILCNSC